MRRKFAWLAAVGLVLSAHTFGMFALSPVSGRLVDVIVNGKPHPDFDERSVNIAGTPADIVCRST